MWSDEINTPEEARKGLEWSKISSIEAASILVRAKSVRLRCEEVLSNDELCECDLATHKAIYKRTDRSNQS